MTSLQILRVDEARSYTGQELRPHYLLSQFGLKGSALVSFEGPCDVKTESLIDWEDRLNHDHIKAEKMLHFMGEFFGITLHAAVFAQRLLAAQIADHIRRLSPLPRPLERDGDDLYLTLSGHERKKLTVSIVTVSPVSVLLHYGMNLDSRGSPVPASQLSQFQVDSARLADDVLFHFEREWNDVIWACAKVRPVF